MKKHTVQRQMLGLVLSVYSCVLFAANHPESIKVDLGWNRIAVNVNQTLSSPDAAQYSVGNLFDAQAKTAWVFDAQKPYASDSKIANPALLSLELDKPSQLFALVIDPGYQKNKRTAFLNAAPKKVKISCYTAGASHAFEVKEFVLKYHGQEYSLHDLTQDVQHVRFADINDNRVTGKSAAAINGMQRLLLINSKNLPIKRLTIEIEDIEFGARYSDTAISGLRLLDIMHDKASAEFKLANYIKNQFVADAKKIDFDQLCLAYDVKNTWPVLLHHQCLTGAASLQLGHEGDGVSDAVLAHKNGYSSRYQIPYNDVLSYGLYPHGNSAGFLSKLGRGVSGNEFILSSGRAEDFAALSGYELTKAFQVDPSGDPAKGLFQDQGYGFFFTMYSRFEFSVRHGGVTSAIYGPTGQQESTWKTK